MLPVLPMAMAGTFIALWIAGFAAGYAVRSYVSYRRRKRERLARRNVAGAPRAFTPLGEASIREPERVPWMRTSPSSMVD